LTLFTGLLFACMAPAGSWASQPVIGIVSGDQTTTLSRDALLQRADLTEIPIQRDPTYKRSASYRAVPLARLLSDLSLKPDEVIEVVATDGFVTPLPADLVFAKNGAAAAVPYLAIEPAEKPWPVIPGKTVSAGPFYLVWFRPEASGVRSEQWPYAVASFRTAESPLRRWPALAVDAALPADSPIRAGQSVFITQCMVCHGLNGSGNADVGPDLNIPQNPTEYLTAPALRQLIRNPASVRHWPDMKMQGFEPDALSDQEIDQIIAYLGHMAGRKTASAPAK
jgi:mono/diheme cytochrome c family protein